MKKYLLGIIAVAMVIGFSAFTSKKADVAFSLQTYYFTSSKKQITQGQANSIVFSGSERLTNSLKWNQTANYAYSNGDYLAGIEFDNSVFTLQQAINALDSYYQSSSFTLPADGVSFMAPNPSGSGTSPIVVHRKATN